MAPWPLGSRSRAGSTASSSNPPATPVRETSKATRRPHLAHLNSHASSSSKAGRAGRPPSPTHSARSVGTVGTGYTRASKVEWGSAAHAGPEVIITRTDLRTSLDTYERLLAASKAYRNAMIALASATSNFASALEDCARMKGAGVHPGPLKMSNGAVGVPPKGLFAQNGDTGTSSEGGESEHEQDKEATTSGEKLLAAAGLHHVMSNQQQLLSDTFYKSFEIPLLEKFDTYKSEVQDRQLTYEKDTGEKSKKIRETEAENMRMGKKKQRDLASFRRALITLQGQVDDLDRIKADYYTEVLAGESETWDLVSHKVALVVRSQMDSADRIVTKSSSDLVIEEMTAGILDPFNAYAAPPGEGAEGRIFTILPPLGISSPATSLSNEPSPDRPSANLARSRVNTSERTLTNGMSGSNSSPASTAKWAEEQKRRVAAAVGTDSDADNEATPKGSRRRRGDQLSWISEGDDEQQRDTDGDRESSLVNGDDRNDRNLGGGGLPTVATDEDEPRWS